MANKLDFSEWDMDEFTAVDQVAEQEIEKELSSVSSERDKLVKKLTQAHNLIMPLLENLLKTADKAYIHWPNRKATIEQKISELKKITTV